MNNAAFGKTMKSAGKHRDINLVTTGAHFSIRTKLSHNKFFFWKFISNRNEKTKIYMNKRVYLSV